MKLGKNVDWIPPRIELGFCESVIRGTTSEVLKEPYLVKYRAKPISGCDSCGDHYAVCDGCGKERICISDFHASKEVGENKVRCQWKLPEGWRATGEKIICGECRGVNDPTETV